MSEIIIHGPPQSSYVRTARMIVEEKGASHTLKPLELGSDAHRALHPWAKVPVLEHGGFFLYETAAIARYLDETLGGTALQPKDAKARGQMEQWMSVLNCYLYGDMVRDYALQYIFPRGAGGAPDRAVIDTAFSNATRHVATLEKALDGKSFLVGDQFTLADAFYAPMLHTFSMFPEAQKLLASSPNLNRYISALTERPTYRKVLPT